MPLRYAHNAMISFTMVTILMVAWSFSYAGWALSRPVTDTFNSAARFDQPAAAPGPDEE